MKKFKFFLITLIILGLGFFAIEKLTDRESYLLRKKANLELPSSSKLMVKEDNWTRLGSEGYSLRVYLLPEEFSNSILESCEQYGYKKGSYYSAKTSSDSKTGISTTLSHLPLLDRHIDQDKRTCSRVSMNDDLSVSVINGNKLIIYISV